jgi:heparan-alpha-glucosaminide N-acetyltransferase
VPTASPTSSKPAPAAPEEAPRRRASVDVLRGVFVAGMIVVEQLPGDAATTWRWLRHAEWTGWTGADLVFPGFLFVVGVTMAVTLRQGWSAATAVRLARRTFVLVGVGLVFNMVGSGGAPLRYPGVLQRIAIAGLLATAAVLLVRRRWLPIVLVVVGLLAAEHLLLTRVTVGCGRGELTRECNVAGAVEGAVFGEEHLYHQGRLGHDPEGLLTTLGATATVLAGWLAGVVLLRRRGNRDTVALLAAGAALLWAAAALWPEILVGKRLWTPTFALLTASICVALLAACVFVFDRWRVEAIAWPFEVLGRNALLVYVGQHVLGARISRNLAFLPDGALMLHALTVLAIWFAVAAVLHLLDVHVSP